MASRRTLRSSYEIVKDVPGEPLVIRDLDVGKSVTNDAENVVEDLVAAGMLQDGRRLLYYDTMGQLDELIIKDGRFADFAPGPRMGLEGILVDQEGLKK